ncbi:Cell division initiation protein DivIVA [Fulvivirga imtechensis AK7]|uniref:Cell division initiation protein DivIVA n=1 Tax=Fulvivirga imtechensis AK7 TaxID=1237149 RepID=L8JM17_9BACT|nr:DivIVA domain-containing protein [Fulvivirga imtechensis]ELR68574.1 Cell division initiation protein DivIVA [Fulvivirga imtechensis AK7]
MKITPLEIRQKTFEKAFRGLDKDEVNAFLVTMSQEWEKLIDENKELRIKLEASEREVEKLREVENSLFKTLKTAEDTGASMIDQATKTAELHMRETQMKAEAILNDAKSRAKDMIEEAEMKSKNTIDEMEDQIRHMAQLYRTLENVKDDLFSDIRSFAKDAIEKVDRVKTQFKKFDVEAELMRVKREAVDKAAKMSVKYKVDEPKPAKEEIPEPEEEERQEEEVVATEEKKPSNNKNTSFFDDIE